MRPLSCFAAVLALALSAVAARADTYSIVQLQYNQHGAGNFYGLDDFGNASIYGPVGCQIQFVSSCYANFRYGSPIETTNSPIITPDNGSSSCNVQLTAVFYRVAGIYCNGSKFVVEGYLTNSQVFPYLYPGGDPLNVIQGVGLADVHINALGDIIYQVQLGDGFFEAFDVQSHTTPEPSSIALLGTGLLGIGAAVRRRFTASKRCR